MKIQKILFCLFTFFACSYSMAQSGPVDTTFGVGGKVITDFSAGMDYIRALAIQSDGKIVAVGSSNLRFAVARYNPDGTLDNTFGIGGKVTTIISGSDQATSVAIQSDGKIVVAGYAHYSYYYFAVVRYNSDGTLDNTFSSDGKLTTAFTTISEDLIYSIGIQNDGKIIVGGATGSYLGANQLALARYEINGDLDVTFGGSGTLKLYTFPNGQVNSLKIQGDGKIVVAGANFGSTSDFIIGRLNSNGSQDSTFGVAGLVVTDFNGYYDGANAMAIQPDGKIIAVGSTSGVDPYLADFALARYNTNGSLDTSFGSGGIVTTDFDNMNALGFSVAIQNDGKIIMAGQKNNCFNYEFATVRYNSNGTLDNTFGSGGRVITTWGPDQDGAYATAIQSNGKILVGGEYRFNSIYPPNYEFALVSYNDIASSCSTIATSQNISICEGDSITICTQTYKVAGTYYNTFAAANGCDSILATVLTTTFLPSYSTTYDSVSNNFTLTVDSTTTALASSYFWDFGDGTTSTLNTPSHTYTADSLYNVCMRIYNASGDSSCVFCNVIGIDSLGNIIRTGGFTLNVQNANSTTSISSNDIDKRNISIFPNPFTFQTTILFSKEIKNSTIKIIDILGNEIKTIKFSGLQLVIEKGDMKAGVYFIQITDNFHTIENRKIVIQ